MVAPAAVESAEDPFVLDIRPAYSYREEHVEGSLNLPIYDQLKGENFIGLDASLDELPDDEEIVIVCFSGSTATVAAEYLHERGYDARAMAGGIEGWEGPTDGAVEIAAGGDEHALARAGE